MSPDSVELVDMPTFIETQRRDRHTAFLIHAQDPNKKTSFARQLAESTGGVYLDVLAIVAGNPDLASKVDTLDARFVKDLAVEAAKGADLVIVDELEFLLPLPLWRGDLSELVEIVRTWRQDSPTVVGFFVRSTSALDALLTDSKWFNAAGQCRVISLEQVKALL